MMAAALKYAETLGWRVFGVGADCRVPFKVKDRFEHGCWDATSDPDEIRWRWTVAHPRANIAVATGDASGVLVIDIDNKNGVDGFASLARLEDWFGTLPESWRSVTPSGAGEHRWFRQPPGLDLVNRVNLPVERGSEKVKLYGLDIRSTGASVAVAPSAKPAGAYRWISGPFDTALADAPGWLLDLCTRPPPPPPGPPIRLTDADRIGRYVAAAVNDELDQLAKCKPGGRNQALFIASAKIGEFVGANLLAYDMAETALATTADTMGLLREDGPNAVRGTITSGLRRGMAQPREVRP